MFVCFIGLGLVIYASKRDERNAFAPASKPYSSARGAGELTGRIVAIADGDTVTLLGEHNEQYKIRVAGIDAPEKKQAFGTRAKEKMSQLVYGKPVTVEWKKRDMYGRIIGKIFVASGECRVSSCLKNIDVGLNQIENGLAWHYKQYEKEQSAADRVAYANAEVDARSKKIGLWSENNPIPPWEFRHKKR